jgi:hypothetical protein
MLSRTSSGIKNIDLFYPNQYIVIVEGQDDVPFWGILFPSEIDGYKCKFKPVGGREIERYVAQVYESKANFAVALDSDYGLFMNKIHDHSQIVETSVHSIENLIISPQTLAEIICVESRMDDYNIENITTWLEHFDQTAYDLMIADYLIQKECLGKQCLGKSCFRFLENSKTKAPYFDIKKVVDFIKSLCVHEDIFKATKEELKSYKPSRQIKGHFFFGASLCFINHEVNKLLPSDVKKRSISNDSFYTALILACAKSFVSCTNSELQSLHKRACQVAQDVVKLLSDRQVPSLT